MKEFNVTGTCIPEKHYMVDTTDKLNQIIRLIETDKYFMINRARQYGKTTTLASLYRILKEKYLVIRLSFEGIGEGAFLSDEAFVNAFLYNVADFLEWTNESEDLISECTNQAHPASTGDSFLYLSKKISNLCKKSSKELILFIDEVDKSSDNQIFLNFLGMLRNKYLRRQEGLDKTFKSVILAGIYDVKNLKLKIQNLKIQFLHSNKWEIMEQF